ncbi:ribonuclease H-like domain-containing protein [Clostridium felsineum]|uniref:ribonuclease H-like domain-containing protein n=1 Tax=Clostridium felsineum TaxID=36839 RepID=UPI00098C8915|nr:ribonuclease H-like domain-containing protein [Clostridium felsineum]URZ15567.1 hypothetical protein CLFE_016120 [Clostridium felsineum DSM 794]
MIKRNAVTNIKIDEYVDRFKVEGENKIYSKALFFDLEHYVYKKPICIGVFGCAYYDEETKNLKTTQYMIENRKDSEEILKIAEEYFIKAKIKLKKEYIVTFSGNNDFTVVNYLFKKNNINMEVNKEFKSIDLQKEYEKVTKKCVGLKNLEKVFEINRESEIISGSTLAKTFGKIVKDEEYSLRMPEEKKDKILLYNRQDVESLFNMITTWNKYVKEVDDAEK